MKFDYPHFIQLHRALLIRFAVLDIILGLCAVFFLSVTLTITTLSLNHLTLLVSGVVFAVFYQIHSYRTCCGNLAYYMMLPVKRVHLLTICSIIAGIPFVISLVVYAGVHVAGNLSLQTGSSTISFPDRLVYLFVVMTIIKLLPLPLMVLYKKHLVLVPLFLLILAALYLFISFIKEMMSMIMDVNNTAMALLFLCGVVFLSGRIIIQATTE